MWTLNEYPVGSEKQFDTWGVSVHVEISSPVDGVVIDELFYGDTLPNLIYMTDLLSLSPLGLTV